MSEMKNIPKHWQLKKLGEVCDIRNGKNQKAVVNPNGKYPIYGSAGIMGYADEYLCGEGATIIGRKGTINRPIYVRTKFWNVDTAFGFSPFIELIESRFLFFFCQSFNFHKLDKSTTIPSLAKTDLQKIELPIPPLLEQQAIVSKIEELFSELDNGIAQLKTAQQQLKVYRQSLLKWAFEGKLTNKNVKEGELPDGWKWMKLGEVAKVSGGLTKNSKRESLTLRVPFLRVGNVYFNRLDLVEMHSIGIKNVEMERVRLEKNDLLFVEGNGSIEQIGRVALWTGEIKNCVHQNHLIKARFSKSVFPKYALYFYCSKSGRDNIKKQANSTSGLHTLNLSKISNLELPITTLKEQQLIVSELESKLTVCDKIEETISQSLQQAETLRQSILKKAFSGELVKNRANPKII